MATGTLTSTNTSQLTLNNTEYNITSSHNVVDVSACVNQTIPVPFATEEIIFRVGTAAGAGQLTNIDIIVLVNRNATNACRLRFADTGAHTFDIRLLPGQTFVMNTRDINTSETEGAFGAFTNIDTISAQFEIANGEIEYLAGQI